MKTDKHNMDVEQLLEALEHAGRDERRQQELGAMIDRMAATESKQHSFWWWGARAAAAACLLFFAGTAARLWLLPTAEPQPMVAEAKVPTLTPEAIDTTIPVAKPSVHRSDAKRVVKAVAPVEEPLVEESLPEELPEEQPEEQVTTALLAEETAPQANDSVETEPILPVTEEGLLEGKTLVTDKASSEPLEPQEHKRSFFASLFQRAEPSQMNGVVLSFNLL